MNVDQFLDLIMERCFKSQEYILMNLYTRFLPTAECISRKVYARLHFLIKFSFFTLGISSHNSIHLHTPLEESSSESWILLATSGEDRRGNYY